MRKIWNEMIKRATREIAKNRGIEESEVTRQIILDSTESFGELHMIACENKLDEYEYEDLVGYLLFEYEM